MQWQLFSRDILSGYIRYLSDYIIFLLFTFTIFYHYALLFTIFILKKIELKTCAITPAHLKKASSRVKTGKLNISRS